MFTWPYVSDNNNDDNKMFSCIVSGSVLELFLDYWSSDYQRTIYAGMTGNLYSEKNQSGVLSHSGGRFAAAGTIFILVVIPK